MKITTQIDSFSALDCHILQLACLSTKKWGLYISDQSGEDLNDWRDLKLPTMLPEKVVEKLWIQGSLVLLFDTEEQLYEQYNKCVGDDGPTKVNLYGGPLRVYALTCDPQGELLTENT